MTILDRKIARKSVAELLLFTAKVSEQSVEMRC
jgi:hypothetical protein